MYKVISISLKDEELIHAIEAYKKSGGNVSGLVSNLLRQYFFNDNNNAEIITKEMLLLLDIKKKIEEFYEWREEILPKLEELETKLKEKQEQEQIENEQPLINELRHSEFTDDLAKTPEEFFARFRDEWQLKSVVRKRLAIWASRKQIPYPKAIKLFCQAFPELSYLFEEAIEVKK